jgi:hypothetical protein
VAAARATFCAFVTLGAADFFDFTGFFRTTALFAAGLAPVSFLTGLFFVGAFLAAVFFLTGVVFFLTAVFFLALDRRSDTVAFERAVVFFPAGFFFLLAVFCFFFAVRAMRPPARPADGLRIRPALTASHEKGALL